jgi:hypothetical protein
MLMRTGLAAALALALAIAGAGCGDDSSETPGGEGTGVDPSGSGQGEANPDATPRELAGSLPDSPQLLLRFSERPAGWPPRVRRGGSSAAYGDGGYVLRAAAGEAIRVPAERSADPANQAVLLETEVRLPPAPAGAGLYCRGSADQGSGYAFTVSGNGRWRIERIENGVAQELGSGLASVETTKPGQPTLLRFLCGAGLPGENLTLAYTINATELQAVNDPASIAPAPGELGVLLSAGPAAASVTFRGLAASYAD